MQSGNIPDDKLVCLNRVAAVRHSVRDSRAPPEGVQPALDRPTETRMLRRESEPVYMAAAQAMNRERRREDK
jgi:hypothetical protein